MSPQCRLHFSTALRNSSTRSVHQSTILNEPHISTPPTRMKAVENSSTATCQFGQIRVSCGWCVFIAVFPWQGGEGGGVLQPRGFFTLRLTDIACSASTAQATSMLKGGGYKKPHLGGLKAWDTVPPPKSCFN